jgi:hypothetical protein
MAAQHGPKVLHMNNTELLVQDLAEAMEEQKSILTDPRRNSILTAYDLIPVIAEVKIMSHVVAYKLGVETKSKPVIQVLDEIVAKCEADNKAQYAQGIKNTLEWTRQLFVQPEIQEVLKMDVTGVEKPASIGDAAKVFKQIAVRAQQEVARVDAFLKRVKAQNKKQQDPPASAPKAT